MFLSNYTDIDLILLKIPKIVVLADEISQDTCRFWDATTGEKLDKDRFRRDLGNVKDAYVEILSRLSK